MAAEGNRPQKGYRKYRRYNHMRNMHQRAPIMEQALKKGAPERCQAHAATYIKCGTRHGWKTMYVHKVEHGLEAALI